MEREINDRFFLNWPVWAARFLKLTALWVRPRIMGFPNLAETGPVILAHWHREDLAMLPHFGFTRARILVSGSRDGSILNLAVPVLGYSTCRGSSSRGALGGLLALKNSLEKGETIVVAADGPRGPRLVAKPGAVYLAAKTGAPIYPAGSALSCGYEFSKSWNKTRLPLPGAKLVMCFGEPLALPPEAARWPQHVQSRLLTTAISDTVRQAELELAAWTGQTSCRPTPAKAGPETGEINQAHLDEGEGA